MKIVRWILFIPIAVLVSSIGVVISKEMTINPSYEQSIVEMYLFPAITGFFLLNFTAVLIAPSHRIGVAFRITEIVVVSNIIFVILGFSQVPSYGFQAILILIGILIGCVLGGFTAVKLRRQEGVEQTL